jgi:hypothetical protein
MTDYICYECGHSAQLEHSDNGCSHGSGGTDKCVCSNTPKLLALHCRLSYMESENSTLQLELEQASIAFRILAESATANKLAIAALQVEFAKEEKEGQELYKSYMAKLDEIIALRNKCGAEVGESFTDFVERLFHENTSLRAIVSESQSETMIENIFLIIRENANLRKQLKALKEA